MKGTLMTENRLSVPTNPARALRELNRKEQSLTPGAPEEATSEKVRLVETKAQEDDPEENNLSEYTTILQTDKQTHLPTYQQTNQQTSGPTNRPTDKPTIKRTNKQTVTAGPVPEPPVHSEVPMRRVDGRTLRARQETADRTMVTSLRLAVSTVEALDEYCWQHRQRKQDVIQAALDMYFAAEAQGEQE